MGSESDQTHSKEEILHQELLHTMILMQPPAEKIHTHLIALRHTGVSILCTSVVCFLSFSYSVSPLYSFPISFLNELLLAIVIGYKLEQMDFQFSRIGLLFSVVMLLLPFWDLCTTRCQNCESDCPNNSFEYARKETGFLYENALFMDMFSDKLQEISSVITTTHFRNSLKTPPYSDLCQLQY